MRFFPIVLLAFLYVIGTETSKGVSEKRLDQLLSQFQSHSDHPNQKDKKVFHLFGQVLDTEGNPIPRARVEIWQTDLNARYKHPRDSDPEDLDKDFQYFGNVATDSEGWYIFRTLIPKAYFPRPRHIHFKVKQGNRTLLTSQFYFADDIMKVKNENMFRAVGKKGEQLLLQLYNYQETILAQGQIYIGRQNKFHPTPSQSEGPYYPLVEVEKFDNDLVK